MDPCSPAAFEERYRADPDPWRFASAPEEQDRYRALLDLLSRDRYRSGYEPACSVGALTVRLAPRCDRLVAVDVAPSAVAAAARRCRDQAHVSVGVGSVTDERLDDLDLVVFSELGYYFSVPALEAVVDRVLASMAPGGELVACHWTGHSEDHVLSGAAVHETLAARPELERRRHGAGPAYLLDSWRRR